MPTYGVYLTDDEALRLGNLIATETPGKKIADFLQEVARTYLEDNSPKPKGRRA